VQTAAHIVACALVSLLCGGRAHAGVDLEPAVPEATWAASDADASFPTELPVSPETDPVEEPEPESELEPELDDFLLPEIGVGGEVLLGTSAPLRWDADTRGPGGVPGSLDRPPRH